MKNTKSNKASIQRGHYHAIVKLVGKSEENDVALGLLYLIADMLDEIADGKDRYMIIGATMNKTAYSVTVKGADAPDPIYGLDLAELGTQALDLL